MLRRACRAAARRTFTRGSAALALARVLAALAHLVCQFRDQDEPRWTLCRLGTPVPWLFPGQSPARPAVDILLGVRLHRHGIDAHAGRNTSRLALAADLPASVLADLTGISISTAERWSQWAKRDWATYVGQRAADEQRRGRQPGTC